LRSFPPSTTRWTGSASPATRSRRVACPQRPTRIDASAIKLRSGADYYLQQIISSRLETSERVELSRVYRSLRERFARDPAIERVNESLRDAQSDVTDKDLSLAIDISEQAGWEASLVPHLDALPFQFIGRGSQNTLKILLALARSADTSHVVLVEEPENHLSPASLSILVEKIAERCDGKQVLIATHSSYVLNKLGLDRLILLANQASTRLTDLSAETLDYFKKLSGYDTLRLVLARRTILVEGPSDELLVQRAYLDQYGKLPIDDGVDVMNVRGLSFRRFLDIAQPLGKRVSVVRDNDGAAPTTVAERFIEYTADGAITVHTGELANGRTLEPQVIAVNPLEVLNAVLGTDRSAVALEEYMSEHKTTWALAVFEAPQAITMPQYIVDAIGP